MCARITTISPAIAAHCRSLSPRSRPEKSAIDLKIDAGLERCFSTAEDGSMRWLSPMLLLLSFLSLSGCVAFSDADSGAPPPEVPPHPQLAQPAN
jgi:hypothetical protein